MKIKLALLSLPVLLTGQATAADFYITGATAFRTAAIKALAASFNPTGFTAGYSEGTSLTGANKSVLRGTLGNIAGTTTIHCTWSGSVEGIRALALNEDVSFISDVPTVAANADGTGGGAIASPTLTPAKAQLAFSDVYKSSTPYATATLFPNNSNVGVVAFTWVAHKSSAAALTNVTTQSARAMFIQGFQPLSLFTGLDADQSSYVFLTGRNDGSGTRTTFLAETGFPIARTLNQYKSDSNGTSLTKLQVWPTGDGSNASTIWNTDTAGNGGYSSGSGLTNVMKAASNDVTVYEADGTTVSFEPAQVSIIGYQSTKDANDSLAGGNGNGGRVLGYNGFTVSYTGSDISAASRKAIVNGQYTMWGYEHLYSRTAINFNVPANDLDRLYKVIRDGCNATNLSNSGIPLSEMMVSRTADGGVVAP